METTPPWPTEGQNGAPLAYWLFGALGGTRAENPAAVGVLDSGRLTRL